MMSDNDTITKAQLMQRIQAGWDEFQAYLSMLSEQQLTTPTDAAGWTAKDHIIHLAIWEDGTYGLLQGLTRYEYMGIPRETWESGDYDQINAVIQERYKSMPLADVTATFKRVHDRLIEHLQAMSDEQLQLPYRHYQPHSQQEKPVINWVSGNTYEHYAEHRPWIDAITR